MFMRVLYLIDSPGRDQLAAEFVRQQLKKFNHKCVFCTSFTLRFVYNRFKPNVIILPKTHKIPHLHFIHKQTVVFLAQAESFLGERKSYIEFSKFLNKSAIDGIFCWGQNDYEYFLDTLKDQDVSIALTGHPIIEHWYKNRNGSPKKRMKRVGIALSIRVLMNKNYKNNFNQISIITNTEQIGDSGYFKEPFHAEDWIAFEASIIRVIYDLIVKNPDVHFSLRPHVHEDRAQYSAFEEFANVEIDTHDHISEWLEDVDVVFSAFSTTFLDAYFSGLKVASLRRLIPQHILQGIHPAITSMSLEKYFEAPRNNSEFRNILDGPPSKSEELEQFGKRVFSFPNKNRPSELMVKFLNDHVDERLDKKEKFSTIKENWYERIFGPFLISRCFFELALVVLDYFTKANRVSSKYTVINVKQNFSYLKLATSKTKK